MAESTTPEEAGRLAKRAREIADQFYATFYPQPEEEKEDDAGADR